ncbi:MAG: phosphoribosylamine--glycine ligase [Phototrophicaceae bacterium]
MAKVLIIGSGGREHALAWSLSRSEQVEQVYVANGNGGTQWEANDGQGLNPRAPSQNIDIPANDFDALIAFAKENDISLTVVGPEVPLTEGIVDTFQDNGLNIFGPAQMAAQIEGSKAFSKDFMHQQGIPTGEFFTTDSYDEARKFLRDYKKPVVVKASGLAAGKGVIVCDTPEEAGEAIHMIMSDKAFGDAGDIIVIEERLQGREISVLAFCDGKTVKPMIVARDYKRALDGNVGLNTGGMGAIAPADDISQDLIHEITETALKPILEGMDALGTPYVGILYAGLMLTEKGAKVLEYNCRFGDPETQVVLPLLKTDLYDIMLACINGTLDQINIEWQSGYCSTVVCASGGYPETYPKGLTISGLETVENSIIFHAGTKQDSDTLLTNGGRVLSVSALGNTLADALAKSYAGVQQITFDGMQYRSDIGEIYE